MVKKSSRSTFGGCRLSNIHYEKATNELGIWMNKNCLQHTEPLNHEHTTLTTKPNLEWRNVQIEWTLDVLLSNFFILFYSGFSWKAIFLGDGFICLFDWNIAIFLYEIARINLNYRVTIVVMFMGINYLCTVWPFESELMRNMLYN